MRWRGGRSLAGRDETRDHHGTEVILHLKEAELEFLQAWTLRSLVTRYSDHIGFPIRLKEEKAGKEEKASECQAEESGEQKSE